MGGYRARDLLLVPSLLSLLRVPLAALFVLVVTRPHAAFSVLIVAGFTDVLDGWYARRYRQVTVTGAVVDPITDKLFVATVVVTLALTEHLRPWQVVLLSVREIGELPLLAWLGTSARARRSKRDHPQANIPGKVATALQFLTVSVALFGSPLSDPFSYVTAVGGAVAALSYWLRAIEQWRRTA